MNCPQKGDQVRCLVTVSPGDVAGAEDESPNYALVICDFVELCSHGSLGEINTSHMSSTCHPRCKSSRDNISPGDCIAIKSFILLFCALCRTYVGFIRAHRDWPSIPEPAIQSTGWKIDALCPLVLNVTRAHVYRGCTFRSPQKN